TLPSLLPSRTRQPDRPDRNRRHPPVGRRARSSEPEQSFLNSRSSTGWARRTDNAEADGSIPSSSPKSPGRRPLFFRDGRSRTVLRSLLVLGGARLGHTIPYVRAPCTPCWAPFPKHAGMDPRDRHLDGGSRSSCIRDIAL